MTKTLRARYIVLRQRPRTSLAGEELRELITLERQRETERRARSVGQRDRFERELDNGYAGYLAGQYLARRTLAPITGAAPIDTGQYITIADAARLLGLSRQRVHQLVKAGRLPAVQVGDRAKVWLLDRNNLVIRPSRGRRVRGAGQ